MSDALKELLAQHSPNTLSGLSRRALALYEEHLKADLEAHHPGRGLAIHPDSGEHLVADTPTEAGRMMARRHPEGGVVTLRIGPEPDYALAGRLLAGQMVAGRK